MNEGTSGSDFPDPFLEQASAPAEPEDAQGDEPDEASDEGSDATQERSVRQPDRARVVQAAQRKAVGKTIQVMQATKKARAATAALLGVANPEDVAAVTIACLTAGKAALRPVRDVLEVAAAGDPFAVMSAAISLADNADRFKAAWDALDTVAHLGRQPANPGKAGMAFAQAASKLTETQKEDLKLPEELIG